MNATHPMKPLSRLLASRRIAWLAPLVPGLALGNPTGAEVVSGDVAITNTDASTLTIDQTTDTASINWQSFSIDSGEYVVFNQPDSSSVILNRVVGGSPSEIFGSLLANGRVFLINPTGVVFGAGAQVDVGALVASTMDISDEDFAAGRYTFTGDSEAGIANAGTITAAEGGFVVLLADTVTNTGLVQAQLGEILLASGKAITLTLSDSAGLITYTIDEAALSERAGVTNAGQLIADGGRVIMTAKTAQALARTVVNNTGLVQAQSIQEGANGEIILSAVGGDVVNSGTLDARGTAASPNGGTVTLVSDQVTRLTSTSAVNTTGYGLAGRGGSLHVSGATVNVRGALNIGRGGLFLLDPSDVTIGNGSECGDAFCEIQVENLLRAGTDVQIVASRSITLENLTDNVLDGLGTGAYAEQGGSLLLGIGFESYGEFSRGAGAASYGISFQDLNDAIKVDGDLELIGGSSFGEVNVGHLYGGGDLTILGVEGVTAGDITIDAEGPRFASASDHAEVYIDASNGAVELGDLMLLSDREMHVDIYGYDGVSAGDITVTGNAYGGDAWGVENPVAQMDIYTNRGDLTINGDINVTANQGAAELELSAGGLSSDFGDVEVYGGIAVVGGGGTFESSEAPTAAQVSLHAQAAGAYGGTVYVQDGVTLTANAVNLSTSFADPGSMEGGFGSTGTSYGSFTGQLARANLHIDAARAIDVGSVNVGAQGFASVYIQSPDVLVRGATQVNATAGAFSENFFLDLTHFSSSFVTGSSESRFTAAGAKGGADVQIVGGSSFSASSGGRITLNGVSVIAPDTSVSIAAGSISLNSSEGVALRAEASGTYIEAFSGTSSGSPFAGTETGNVEVHIEQVGSSGEFNASGDVLVKGLTNADGSLDIYADGDIFLDGDVTVMGVGPGITGSGGGPIVVDQALEVCEVCSGSEGFAAGAFVRSREGSIFIGSEGGTANVTVSGTNGQAFLDLLAGTSGSGSVNVWGGLSVTGGSGEGKNLTDAPDVASAFISAGSSSGSGNIFVRDSIVVDGNPVSWSSSEGYASGIGGNASLHLGSGSDVVPGSVTVGSILVTAAGDANLTANAQNDVEVVGTTTVTAFPASFTDTFGATSSAGTTGQARIDIHAGNNCSFSFCVDPSSNVSLGAVAVTGPNAELYVRGGTIDIDNGGAGNAITVDAEGFHTTFTSSEGATSTERGGEAVLNLSAHGGSSESAAIDVTGPILVQALAQHADANAFLTAHSYSDGASNFSGGDIELNGNVTVEDSGGPNEVAAAGLDVNAELGNIEIDGNVLVRSNAANGFLALTASSGSVFVAGTTTVSGGNDNGRDANISISAGGNVFLGGLTTLTANAANGTAHLDIDAGGSVEAYGATVTALQPNANAFAFLTGSYGVTVNGDLRVEDSGGGTLGAVLGVAAPLGSVDLNGDVKVRSVDSFASFSGEAYGDLTITGTTAVQGFTGADVGLFTNQGDITVHAMDVDALDGSAQVFMSAGSGALPSDSISINGNVDITAASQASFTAVGAHHVLVDGNIALSGSEAALQLTAVNGQVDMTGTIHVRSTEQGADLAVFAASGVSIDGSVLVEALNAFEGTDGSSADVRIAMDGGAYGAHITGTLTARTAGTLGAGGDVLIGSGGSPIEITADGGILVQAGDQVRFSDAFLSAGDSADVGIYAGGDVQLWGGSVDGRRVDLQAGVSADEGYGDLLLGSGAVVSGDTIYLVANHNVSDSGSASIDAGDYGGFGVSAGNAILMTNTNFVAGTGGAPFGGDPLLGPLLTFGAPDVTPLSLSPNAAFSAPTIQIEAANLSMTGDNLFLQMDQLDLGSGTASVPSDLVVHYQAYTAGAPIHVMNDITDVSPNAGELYLGRVQHFDRFPGTTHIFGGSVYFGDVFVGEGPVAGIPQAIDVLPDSTNFIFITNGGASGLEHIFTNGTVALIQPFLLSSQQPLLDQYQPSQDDEEEDQQSAEDQLTDAETGDDGGIEEQSGTGAAGECT